CLATPTATPTPKVTNSTSATVTSTCSRSSTTGCPTAAPAADPCCRWICVTRNNPYFVCSPFDATRFPSEDCRECPALDPATNSSSVPETTKPTATPSPTNSTSTSYDTATCGRYSTTGCPTAAPDINPCCQYLCLVKQLPWYVCSPYDGTDPIHGSEDCLECPGLEAVTNSTSQSDTATNSISQSDTATNSTSQLDPATNSTSTFTTSTCSRSSTSACPTTADPCCKYTCSVAQVPFDVCSPSDTSGPFEKCNKCPVPTPTPSGAVIL
ncbi:MAG: hypothetical protein Q9183_005247, partial [Haloplaca sp. 2 TL-2023]